MAPVLNPHQRDRTLQTQWLVSMDQLIRSRAKRKRNLKCHTSLFYHTQIKFVPNYKWNTNGPHLQRLRKKGTLLHCLLHNSQGTSFLIRIYSALIFCVAFGQKVIWIPKEVTTPSCTCLYCCFFFSISNKKDQTFSFLYKTIFHTYQEIRSIKRFPNFLYGRYTIH